MKYPTYKTAESVTLGHPDKLCDYIADSILDDVLSRDKNARVAVEVMLAHHSMFIGGEVTMRSDATLGCSFSEIAEQAILNAGYFPPKYVHQDIVEQSEDIAQAVDRDDGEQGAGDQGIVYGYATEETLSELPLATELAQRLTRRLMLCAMESKGNIGPDGKAQVTVAYTETGAFDRIANVLISVQHSETAAPDEVRAQVLHEVIERELEDFDIEDTEILVNPGGLFVIGGFEADTGLTGRKIMVDTYGGLARHGGGAFSGKDPSKLDRSGAYMARYIAKTIVEAGLASECEVAISYAIGRTQPTAINVNTLRTWKTAWDPLITEAVKRTFDLTPAGIIAKLGLTSVRYCETAINGHFGAEKPFPWEKVQPDDVKKLKANLNEVLSGLTGC